MGLEGLQQTGPLLSIAARKRDRSPTASQVVQARELPDVQTALLPTIVGCKATSDSPAFLAFSLFLAADGRLSSAELSLAASGRAARCPPGQEAAEGCLREKQQPTPSGGTQHRLRPPTAPCLVGNYSPCNRNCSLQRDNVQAEALTRPLDWPFQWACLDVDLEATRRAYSASVFRHRPQQRSLPEHLIPLFLQSLPAGPG